MTKTEIYVGGCTVTIEDDKVCLTRYTGWSDCGHTVKGPDLARLRSALGMAPEADLAQHLRHLDPYSAAGLHETFIANATENFSWWDMSDMDFGRTEKD